MSDSDDDCVPLKRVNSVTLPLEWEEVPNNTDFIFKVKLVDMGGKWCKLAYKLKKGVLLPYSPDIDGLQVTFNKKMEPEMHGKVARKEKDYWKFEDEEPVAKKTKDDLTGLGDVLTAEMEEVLDVEPPRLALEKAVVKLGGSGILQFGCVLCSYKAQLSNQVKEHIDEEHKNWRDDLEAVVIVLPKVAANVDPENVDQSPHTNPDWLPNLTVNFLTVIVEKCSSRCREALENNEIIEDPRDRKDVRDELLNTTVAHLEHVFKDVQVPGKSSMREVAATLGTHYPNMFRVAKPGSAGALGYRPTLKVPSLNELASNIIDRFRGKKKRRKTEDLDVATTPTSTEKKAKLGKKKLVYGVNLEKFVGAKATPEGIAAISKTSGEPEFEKRESVFVKFRPQIQAELSNPNNRISQVCKGFWKHYMHLSRQFEYVSGVGSRLTAVKQNLITQIGYLEKFLAFFDSSMEFADKMSDVEAKCNLDYGGAELYKYIMILRFAGSFFDTDGAVLVRLESDDPAKTSSPYISVKEFEKTFIFSLHVEKDELLGTLEFEEAIAAFIHICFVCDIKYPKEASTLGDIIQRQIAKYGDDSGTRCFGNKGKAQTKFDRYLAGLGKVLAQ